MTCKTPPARLVGRLLAIAIAVACSANMAPADASDTIATDRPDFSESTGTVEPNRIQVEGGYTFTDAGGVDSHTVGELLVRIGLNDRTELRLGLPSYLQIDLPRSNISGWSDPSVGLKLKLPSFAVKADDSDAADGKKPIDFALTVSTTLPAGSSEFSSDDPQPRAALAVGRDLPRDRSFGANLGYSYLSSGTERFGEISGSLSLSGPVGKTDRASAFVEVFGYAPESSGGDNTNFLGAGFLWRPKTSDDVQFDVRAGTGLNSASADFYFGFGVAWRQ